MNVYDPRDFGFIGNGDVANAEGDTSSFERIFELIKAAGGSGTIELPYCQGMISRRLRPMCRIAIVGRAGYIQQTSKINGSTEGSWLNFFTGSPGLVLDSPWTSDGGIGCQGSYFSNVIISGAAGWNGSVVRGPHARTYPRIAGATRAVGDWIDVPGDYSYEVVQSGVAGNGSDPSGTWPTVDGSTVTDGTMVLAARFAAGIWCRTQSTFHRVREQAFRGFGFVVRATTLSAAESPDDIGVADDCRWYECRADYNLGHGIRLVGGDASTCTVMDTSISQNYGHGVWDSGFLGNTFIDVHTESNRLSPFELDNRNSQSVLINCYTEGDQPPSRVLWPNRVSGGPMFSGFTADSDGEINDRGIRNRMAFRTKTADNGACEVSLGGTGDHTQPSSVLTLRAYDSSGQLSTSCIGLCYGTGEPGWWNLTDETGGGLISFSTSRSQVGPGCVKFNKGLYYGTPGDPYIPSPLRYVATGEWFRSDVFNLVNGGHRDVGDRADGADVWSGRPGTIARVDYAFAGVIRAGVTTRGRWTPGTAHNANERLVPTIDNGHAYVASGGTTGQAEPVWPTTPGSAVLDGTCTWTESGTAAYWREYGSVGGYIAVDVTGQTTLVLDALSVAFNTESIEVAGTGCKTLVLPSLPGYKRWIWNRTDGPVAVRTVAGIGLLIAQGMAAWVSSGNGANILRQTADVMPL